MGQRPRNQDDTIAQGRPVKDIICYKCGKKGHYEGRCGRNTRCGDGGHMRNDCPHWNKSNIVCWRCDKVGHYQFECTRSKDLDKATQTEGPHEYQRGSQQCQLQQQQGQKSGGQKESAVRRVTFAKDPAVGVSGLKDAEGGGQQQECYTHSSCLQ